MSVNKKILVVDDEIDILDLLKYNLEKEGYQVEVAENGMEAVRIAKTFVPDLILLDIMMPGQDGVETCRQLREFKELANSFIIFLTARVEEYSEVAAFENGADDYLTKPIKPRALMSRINAIFRRSKKEVDQEEKVTAGDLHIDKQSYTVKRNDEEFSLPKKEFELLYFLAQHPGKVFSRDELLYNIWGTDVYVLARTVDVHVRKVREKIGDGYIATIKGVGYKFDAE
ncbi:response regulator transcription factor [Gilvimarinus agarilyticus]|uniref:Phosphate regulon transcriptional regulatory protein PhoB n=1 Tax=Reichenbachiella agariperforans TaxID=156994 RepID=A0A1M6LWX2_REIAG|nr:MULTISPECIES: response regulator transcription factor [Reichenbachiella]MBU2885540.1 response regulator transcription factor [Gilvimarinus agarilyticus]MBU2914080.1 response regulator transcription factor [Reichenbachiella agariperforans]RJE74017.1 DNA-binding response regulator [Reichenbachiella sp. MSK19-1]SHJ75655.1 two-component system, OmpR family, alkaline phosphatase synthesis response regulator PhoP [Reichenbachiella agariperforans]